MKVTETVILQGSATNASNENNSSGTNAGAVAAAVIVPIAVVALGFGVFFYLRRPRNRPIQLDDPKELPATSHSESGMVDAKHSTTSQNTNTYELATKDHFAELDASAPRLVLELDSRPMSRPSP